MRLNGGAVLAYLFLHSNPKQQAMDNEWMWNGCLLGNTTDQTKTLPKEAAKRNQNGRWTRYSKGGACKNDLPLLEASTVLTHKCI
ncbi:unnamed protein product [Sphenostylis stenocarpa]|uniref:Uncharacterized protein n=1 Tax=Sphenostylis stenocarpa TaxID=92480 RepID=A0AA86SE13_9FABA|nr:unnamed protein product [Sphenostylis stenocarpa]